LATAGATDNPVLATWLACGAVVLATINVVGGYMVTDLMLAMFKKREGGK
jgi:NAD(P) transhydrogenase subunit alpha